jgi:cold shock CspA family protein/uncharacterized protein YbjQ (UPF0145 family)
MEGTISSFLPSKGYGFVQGDDGRPYFLHQSDLVDEAGAPIEGQRVIFEESATPKGYRARRVRPVAVVGHVNFVVPSSVQHSKDSQINGWDIVEATRWSVTGSSRHSPDDARSELLSRARRIGANGLIHVQYFKTRGSEPGTGKGTHYFTIHNYRGHAVSVGRLSAFGAVKKEHLEGVANRASALKLQLEAATTRSRRQASFAALGVAVAGGILALCADGFPVGFVMVFSLIVAFVAYSALARDHDSWLSLP